MDSAQPARPGGSKGKSNAAKAADPQPPATAPRTKKTAAKATPPEKTDKVVNLEKLVMEQSTAAKPEKTEVTALSVQAPAEKPAKREPVKVPVMGSIFDRPVGPGAIEVYEEFSVAGMRPIAASNMPVYGTILNGRPIMASNIQVLDLSFPGQRPVFTSSIQVRDDLTLPGGRPIIASDDRLLDAELLPGGRPIASNDIDNDMTDFIGYID